jgi:hypothetical protein
MNEAMYSKGYTALQNSHNSQKANVNEHREIY